MVHSSYIGELIGFQITNVILILLYGTQLLAYHFTYANRPAKLQLLLVGSCALLVQSVRQIDGSSVFGILPQPVQNLLGDQVTSILVEAAVITLITASRVLYTLMQKPIPRMIVPLFYTIAFVYHLGTTVTGVVECILIGTTRTPDLHLSSDIRFARMVLFQLMCLGLIASSCSTLIRLRTKVSALVDTLQRIFNGQAEHHRQLKQQQQQQEQQQLHLAPAEPSTPVTTTIWPVRVAPATSAPPSTPKLMPTAPLVAPLGSPPSLILDAPLVARMPTTGAVVRDGGGGDGGVNLPTPSLAPSPVLDDGAAAAGALAYSTFLRLRDLRIAASKVTKLNFFITLIVTCGFLYNISPLIQYARGDIFEAVSQPDEPAEMAWIVLPICQQLGLLLIVWYAWIEARISWHVDRHATGGAVSGDRKAMRVGVAGVDAAAPIVAPAPTDSVTSMCAPPLVADTNAGIGNGDDAHCVTVVGIADGVGAEDMHMKARPTDISQLSPFSRIDYTADRRPYSPQQSSTQRQPLPPPPSSVGAFPTRFYPSATGTHALSSHPIERDSSHAAGGVSLRGRGDTRTHLSGVNPLIDSSPVGVLVVDRDAAFLFDPPCVDGVGLPPLPPSATGTGMHPYVVNESGEGEEMEQQNEQS